MRTYFSNTFLFDKYFSRDLIQEDKKVNANYQQADYLINFNHRHYQDGLLEFSDWLNKFIHSDKFIKIRNEFNEIEKQLETEPVGQRRTMLVNRLHKLI